MEPAASTQPSALITSASETGAVIVRTGRCDCPIGFRDSMKIVRRIIFNGLAALSLLLCAATVALWLRSYTRTDRISWWRESPPEDFARGAVARLVAERGRIAFVYNPDVECVWFMPMTPGFTSSRTLMAASASGARGLIDWPARCWWPPIGEVQTADVHRFAGFERGQYTVVEPYNSYLLHEYVWALPLPFIAAVFALIPVVRLRAFVRGRRRWCIGLCPHCGYDLRATPDRCPECGTVAEKVKA
jgi:hypothetical protein